MAAPVSPSVRALVAGLALPSVLAVSHGPADARDSTAIDPTRPPALLGPAATQSRPDFVAPNSSLPTGLVLQAILHSDGRPARALINGRIARTGDLVEGARIRSIDDDHVLLAVGGQSLRLELTPGVRVKPSLPASERSGPGGTATVPSIGAAGTPTDSNRPR